MNREDIKFWLYEYGIDYYTFNADLSVNILGGIYLNNLNLKEFPFQFGAIDGDFTCYNNQLTNLKGSPRIVRGYFNCSYNELTSLEGAPREINGRWNGDFHCEYNKLQTLYPYIGNIKFNKLYCSNNSEQVDREVKQLNRFNSL